MIKKERITIRLCIRNNLEYVRSWMMQMKLFTPTNMRFQHYKKGKTIEYNENVFVSEIEKETINVFYDVLVKNNSNSIGCFMNVNSDTIAILSAVLEYDIFLEFEEKIYTLISEIMNQTGVVARIASLEDNYWQNNIDLDAYKLRNKSLKGIPITSHPIFKTEKAVDVEKLPGYEAQIGNIWFGAGWKMWFNDFYYQFISEEGIEKFNNCYQNQKVLDSCRCVTLYKNILEYDKKENRKRQWEFKRAINFIEVVRNLKATGITTSDNPHMEISNGKFEHGGIKLFKIYLDENDKCISKDKAVKTKVLEYATNGQMIWSAIENNEINNS